MYKVYSQSTMRRTNTSTDNVLHKPDRIYLPKNLHIFVDCLSVVVPDAPSHTRKRKNHNYTKSFINTIHANRLQSFQIRNREQRNQYNSTYPKRPIHLHRLEVTRHQHTQWKWEKHNAKFHLKKFHSVECPSHSHIPITRHIENSEWR